MNVFLPAWVAGVNDIGREFCCHAAGVFVQSGVLIVALLAADLLLRRHVRATVRYWIWMLVMIKLLLPPTFSLPTGAGHWLGRYVAPPVARQALGTAKPQETFGQPKPPDTAGRPSGPPLQPSNAGVEAAVTETVPVPGERLTGQGGAVLLWGVGVLAFAGLVLRRVFFVRRLVAQGRPAQGNPVDLVEECRRRMNIHRPVRMKLLPGAFSPAVCGLCRPTILLPEMLSTRLAPDNLRAVLIHELAHIKRADLWVNCLQTILQVIYFYNPLVWLANAIVRRVREQAVDEMSLVVLGAEARSYGNTLIDIAEMAFGRANPALRVVGVAESKKSLEGRIKHMVTRPIPRRANVGPWGLLAVIVAGVVLLPMAKAERNSASPAAASTLGGFAATLPDGVTVELAALGTAPWKTEQQWWQPDGTRIGKPEFKTVQNQPPLEWADTGQEPQFRCALLVRLSAHTGKDVSMPWLRCSYNRLGVGMRGGIAEDGTQLLYLVSFPSEIPDTVDIFQAVCTGRFKEAKPVSAKLNGQAYEVYALDGGLTLIRHPLYVGATKRLTADVSCPRGDFEYRLTARLKNGQSEPWHTNSITRPEKSFVAPQRHENLKAEDIEQLVIEYRPYQWVTFAGVSLVPGQKADVQVRIVPRETTTAKEDRFTIYLVNRWVAGFPPTEDLSTPEAAYATVNRLLAAGDVAGLPRVSIASRAARLARESRLRQAPVDPEWAKVLINARTRQVIVYDGTRAAVLAELPQALSNQKIVAPIDVRYLELEDGRWLNTGNNRFWTTEEAKAQFLASVE